MPTCSALSQPGGGSGLALDVSLQSEPLEDVTSAISHPKGGSGLALEQQLARTRGSITPLKSAAPMHVASAPSQPGGGSGLALGSSLTSAPLTRTTSAPSQTDGGGGQALGSRSRLCAADGGGSVSSSLGTPVETQPVVIGQPRDKSSGGGTLSSPQLPATGGDGSGSGANLIVTPCEMAFRTRGRRAGRRNPYPKRVVEPCASRSRRIVIHG